MTNNEIENNFTYHAPSADMPPKFEKLRNKAKELAFLINELVPNGREQSLAQTKLQEVIMWANAGIAIPKVGEKHGEELPEFIEENVSMFEYNLGGLDFIIKSYESKGYKLESEDWSPCDNYTKLKFRRIK